MSDKIVILDASLVIKAILPNSENAACQAVLERFQDELLAAPALWTYEIASTLTKAVHFDQLTEDEGHAAIHQALSLGVQIILPDEMQSMLAYQWALKLKRASAYDCFYLAVAEALDADFWTADQRLYHSLQTAKLSWLHWSSEIA